MSGKVFNSTMFLDMGSKLQSNPFQIKFLNDLLHNVKNESNLLTLEIDESLIGRTYDSVYNEFLEDKNIPLLCLGVFTRQLNQPIEKYLISLMQLKEGEKIDSMNERKIFINN